MSSKCLRWEPGVVFSVGLTITTALMANLRADTVDSTYGGTVNGSVAALSAQPDGKVLVGGAFTTVGGANQPYLARLNGDGSVDHSFVLSSSPAQPVNGVAVVNGKLYASGGDGLRRYDTNGALEWVYPQAIKTFAVDASGRVLIGGQFTRLDGGYHRNLARLTTSGTVDSSYAPAIGCCAGDGAFSVVSSGDTLLVGGFFQTVNATNGALNLTSLDANGSMSPNFVGQADTVVLALAPLSDGRFVRVSERTVARHLANGELDASFTPLQAVSGDNRFTTTALLADGRVVVGGQFSLSAANNITRLNANGSVDPSLNIQPDGAVQAIAVLPDGNILIGGSFSHVNGANAAGLARVVVRSAAASNVATLRIAGAAAGVVLSWNGPATYTVQYKELGSAGWSALPASVTQSNGANYVVDGANHPGRLYRLAAQP